MAKSALIGLAESVQSRTEITPETLGKNRKLDSVITQGFFCSTYIDKKDEPDLMTPIKCTPTFDEEPI